VYDIHVGDIVYFDGENPINYDYGTFTYFHHDRKKDFKIRVKYYKRVEDVKTEFFGMEGDNYPVLQVDKVYEPDCEIPSISLGPWTVRPEMRKIRITKRVVVAYPAYKKKKITTTWYWEKGKKPIGILKKYSGQ